MRLFVFVICLFFATPLLANRFWDAESYDLDHLERAHINKGDIIEMSIFDRAPKNPELRIIGEVCDFNRQIVITTTGTYKYIYCVYIGDDARESVD